MSSIGCWYGECADLLFSNHEFTITSEKLQQPVYVVLDPTTGRKGIAVAGSIQTVATQAYPLLAVLPAMDARLLGGGTFQSRHGTQFAYVGGAMARGISSTRLVIALGRLGMLGFFGAAGLALHQVEAAILDLAKALNPIEAPFGMNLIHTPDAPELEEALVALYLKHQVLRVSASAFMSLSKHIVWYAAKGLSQDANGYIHRRNYLFAKISHPTTARHFMSPPPADVLAQLVHEGKLTQHEAHLASQIPVAEDIKIEADSGGHTDNRSLSTLFPRILRLKEELEQTNPYARLIRLGAAGGLGTPSAVAAAYALGAHFVSVGSVHQAAIESGLSESGKLMLSQADIDDVIMTSAADMFELGVKVQVLKRGTMMGARGNHLHALYKDYESIDALPLNERLHLEKNVFRMPLEQVWDLTQTYFSKVRPLEIAKAMQNPKYKMALLFRWYLGNSSRWPILGEPDRKMDYQIWCGPAMGSFNAWVKGSFLESPEQRHVGQIALNLLEGAAKMTRLHQLRTAGVPIASSAFYIRPSQYQMLYQSVTANGATYV